MRILAIETSCDETASAVVENGTKILSNVVSSSLALHAKTGGIIPENAAREQIKYIIPVIKEAIENCKLEIENLDALAVTVGPGLIGSLLIGVETAKALAFAWNKPLIPVNHLIGHIYANFLTANDQRPKTIIEFPALVLIVSGGHTDLVLMKDHGKLKWLGGTRDDAAGELFDKVGRLLNLPYPGGPSISAEADKFRIKNSESRITLPRPMINSQDFDFSFSGLKTAVLREVNKLKEEKQFNDPAIHQLSYEVQKAVVEVLISKTIRAAEKYRVKSILLSGGVSANDELRNQCEQMTKDKRLKAKFFAPVKNLCTDNAAMIASAAFFNYKPVAWQKITANPELHF